MLLNLGVFQIVHIHGIIPSHRMTPRTAPISMDDLDDPCMLAHVSLMIFILPVFDKVI